MPQSKVYSERERMIDKCLSSGREYTGEQLMREVNTLLRSRGMMEISSRSTFAADINKINSKYFDTYHQDIMAHPTKSVAGLNQTPTIPDRKRTECPLPHAVGF